MINGTYRQGFLGYPKCVKHAAFDFGLENWSKEQCVLQIWDAGQERFNIYLEFFQILRDNTLTLLWRPSKSGPVPAALCVFIEIITFLPVSWH